MYITLSLSVSESVFISSPSYTLSFVYMEQYMEYYNFNIGKYSLRGKCRWWVWWEVWICWCFMFLYMCEKVYVHVNVCMYKGRACVCWPWRYTIGHLYRPSAPTKLPLGVGVLTMFWTISSNKSQPKLLVSISLAKWQNVHPPKSSPQKQAGRDKETKEPNPMADNALVTLLW